MIVIMVNPEYYRFMRELSRHEAYRDVLDASEDQLEKQRDMEYVCRFLVHTFKNYDRRLDVEDFIDANIVELAEEADIDPARRRFTRTFDLLYEAHGANALRRFDHGNARGRVLLAAYECIAIGVARNLRRIRALPDPVAYVRRRIEEFWASDDIDNFFVAGLRGTARIQRTIPFGERWFAE